MGNKCLNVLEETECMENIGLRKVEDANIKVEVYNNIEKDIVLLNTTTFKIKESRNTVESEMV